MSPETVQILSSLAASSPVAFCLMTGIIVLWNANKAKDRCPKPETEPCGICRICMTATWERKYNRLVDAVKHQEDRHLEEIREERTRVDELREEQKETLRQLLEALRGEEA